MDHTLKYLPSTIPVEFKEAVQNTARKMLEHVGNRSKKYKNINIIALNIVIIWDLMGL